jgi:hypothetical protein
MPTAAPSQLMALFRPPDSLPQSLGPRGIPSPLLTPVRVNDQLGHPERKYALGWDGHRLLLAQVAFAVNLRDGYGLRTGLWHRAVVCG